MTDKKIATVIGVGPGLGAALARRFAPDYAVALVARNEDKLRELARAGDLFRRRNFARRSG